MLWFIIVVVVAVFVAGFCLATGDDIPDAAGIGALILVLGGVVALFLNGILAGVDLTKSTYKCNLAPISVGSTSYAAARGGSVYYRCEGNNSPAPSEVDYAYVYYSNTPHLEVDSHYRKHKLWSIFCCTSDETRLYLPNNVIATALDNG